MPSLQNSLEPALSQDLPRDGGIYATTIQAAEDGKWDSAIVMEGLQNDLATLLNDVDIDGQKGNCIPGFKRM